MARKRRPPPPSDGGSLTAAEFRAGKVPAGWSAGTWKRRLTYLAGVCIEPERARELREAADAVKA